MKNLLLITLFFVMPFGMSAQLSQPCAMPSNKKIDKAMKSVWETSCRQVTTKRLDAMDVMQCAANNLTHTQFNNYQKSTDEAFLNEMESEGILRFWDQSFSKIIKEVKATKVPNGSVVLWQIYNMGYVVKTPTMCFGIDVKHKRALELVPYLDFLLTTHKHGDHYMQSVMDAMQSEGKPVVSNFYDKGVVTRGGDTLHYGDIEITTRLIDHNKQLPNFVVGYEINCGKQTNYTTIMHIGDGYNASQLNPTLPTDIFIYHMRVGLNVQNAVEILKPKLTLLSHVLELAHDMQKNRWPFAMGLERAKGVNWPNVCMPVWGEMIVWEKK